MTNKEIKAINDAMNWQHFKHLATNIIRDRQEFLWARGY